MDITDACLRARARLDGRMGILMLVMWVVLVTTRTLWPPMLPLVCGVTFLLTARHVHPGEARPYLAAGQRILFFGGCWAFMVGLWCVARLTGAAAAAPPSSA